MSSTDLEPVVVLRTCYAMSGTDLAYMALRTCCAMPGTELRYGATGRRRSAWGVRGEGVT
eukprot:965855-Rhodomonas_salina.6